MGRYTVKRWQLFIMVLLTTLIFLVKIIVGYIRNSKTLVDDSLHMLSGIVAMLVALSSVELPPKKWSENIFSWVPPSEVLGALVNSVFLVALCFSFILVAFKRFIEVETIHNSILICEVGILGLIVNIIGLIMVRGHHSHDDTISGRSHTLLTQLASAGVSVIATNDYDNDDLFSLPNSHSHNKSSVGHKRGIYLHIFGQALVAVISTVFDLIVLICFTDWKVSNYVDLDLSLLIVAIILHSVWMLLQDSALVLLQTVPTRIEVGAIQSRFLDEVDRVYEFHLWHLTGNRIIGSVLIRCRNLSEYMKLVEKVKIIVRNEGIHLTTILPEFVEAEMTENRDKSQTDDLKDDCKLDCPETDLRCHFQICCCPSKHDCETPLMDTPCLCHESTYVNIDAILSS